MKHRKGFTLIELLVVIAIITILASIVAPRVSNWIARGRMAKAVSEIRNADLALTKMLSDAGRSYIGHLWTWTGTPPSPDGSATAYDAAVKVYTGVFYELLRKGKTADLAKYGLAWRPRVRESLATSYMDLGFDPWGKAYQFYAGPLGPAQYGYEFRCHRMNSDGVTDNYVYDQAAKDDLDLVLPGNPQPDGAAGYPCSRDLNFYMFSCGEDGEINQKWTGGNGGDDINNWDNDTGWATFYP